MGRKGRSVTLSLSDEDKVALEQLALDYGMTWGERANISKLIEAIARKKLKIASNHDWSEDRITALDNARRALNDVGQKENAQIVTELLLERAELKIPQRQQLEQFLERDVRPWRVTVERLINRQQPFQLSYQDAADNLFQFTIRHAHIVIRNDRQYLDCWCEEIGNSKDIEAIAHNRTLRLDRITEAAVVQVRSSWKPSLDKIIVTMNLYGMLAFNYSSKHSRDISVEWRSDDSQVRCVKREITSTFWFVRSILPYGKDCEVVGPPAVREMVGAIAHSMAQHYAK